MFDDMLRYWRPPARLSLSEWADANYYLSAESSAEAGRWRTISYQREIMDAITDPAIEFVTLKKSSRVGGTKILNATIGYYMDQDPCPILLVQPTVDDAEGYSKEEIAPMLRDCPKLRKLVGDQDSKKSSSTILSKSFPGGVLTMVGANSGRGFRRVSRRVVLFDETDGYPASAGNEGDQIRLGIKRSEYYWNRKIVAVSTPLVAGASRIDDMFDDGDQRHYHVPCPDCGFVDVLVFREQERGHFMQWPEGEPLSAYFVCKGNGCIIEHESKLGMLDAGEWIADSTSRGHASFHIWAAYSTSPNATWGQIAEEFISANKGGPEKLRTFINTTLGETWTDKGEAPEWERLHARREQYPIGSVPEGVKFLTSGVDVQKDRFVVEVVGWAQNKESWSIDAFEIHGDTADDATWSLLDEALGRSYPRSDGHGELSITVLAIDSGYNTQTVYNWARRHSMQRVIACKGMTSASTLLGVASPVDLNVRGRRRQRGYKVWPVGVGIAKSELYGWLRLKAPVDGDDYPAGYCHFPEHAPEFFKQLTAEHLVAVRKRSGFTLMEWHLLPNRENHWLDCRILARVAAARCGLDRYAPRAATSAPAESAPRTAPRKRPQRKLGSGWLSKRR